MIVVTTLTYDQLATLIRDKKVSLNNEDLLLGDHYKAIQDYILERLGGDGFMMAIRGRINQASVELLSQLDKGLRGNKVIIEAAVNPDDLLIFNVDGLDKAVEIINYGLPAELVDEALDEARSNIQEGAVQITCAPCIHKSRNIRITSLNRDIDVGDADITFVKLRKDS